jgi:hypothetical protein
MYFLGANRLRIVEYFDELKAKVDICVETFIAANYQDKEKVAKTNEVRTEWLKEIDECEKFNLIELKKREDKNSQLQDEQLFKKLIFEFELSEGKELIDLRLISIDTYIKPGKIKCFQIALKVIEKDINAVDMKENCLEKLFVLLEQTDINVTTNRLHIIHRTI